MDDLAAFARLVDALRPWLGQLVIVGGWAHRLHRFHPDADTPPHAPLHTRDVDVAFASTAALEGNIAHALRDAGFREELRGQHTPPVTHYHLGGPHEGFYTEFLAPQVGDGLKRTGERDVTLARAGITAQKLRFVDMLLISPWTVKLDRSRDIPVSEPTDVRIANPVSFIAQKLLIQSRREAAEKAQDTLYVHDTLELFSGKLEVLRTEWFERVAPQFDPRSAARIQRLRRVQYDTVTDVIRNAARIPADRRLSPGRIQQACVYGLGEVFRSP